jgi:A/G-specific adenine glycosylase
MNERDVYFRKELIRWHNSIDRCLPWKEDSDPYCIWISEIILQQTRVAQGTKYYLRFIDRFPSLCDLATSDLEEVLKVWKGLGYYSRARNLHHTAKVILRDHQGIFPRDYETLINLKGIGSYTAAAILSFAYNEPYPVVDGNVIRVLSRIYGIREFVDKKEGIKRINEISKRCLDKDDPATYNQAIMDFGALACKPQAPMCETCLMIEFCSARQEGRETEYPFKSAKKSPRARFFHYFLLNHPEGHIYILKREGKDVWRDLYELPQIEYSAKSISKKLLSKKFYEKYGQDIEISTIKFLKEGTQLLSHQRISASFYQGEIKGNGENFLSVPASTIRDLPMPKIIDDFMKSKIAPPEDK